MKFLFIGLGSIGKRHIRNLKSILKDQASITILRSGKGQEADEEIKSLAYDICFDDSQLEDSYDAVFITNPTSAHYKTLKNYLGKSRNFFIEKPVFVSGREDIGIFDQEGKTFYVACPLRYSNVIRYLHEHIDFKSVHAMRCISSSFLPEWRPGTDYRKCYSAQRDMGGGVAMDLIHEWDYIQYLAGVPRKVHSLIKKKSNLEIDSDDIAVYIAEYPDMIVEVHLDYFGRKPVRTVELYAEEDTIAGDLINQEVKWLKSGRRISLGQDRDAYQIRELEHFLIMAEGKMPSDNTLEEACRTLRIARGEEV